jgi:hypothetical protein
MGHPHEAGDDGMRVFRFDKTVRQRMFSRENAIE